MKNPKIIKKEVLDFCSGIEDTGWGAITVSKPFFEVLITKIKLKEDFKKGEEIIIFFKDCHIDCNDRSAILNGQYKVKLLEVKNKEAKVYLRVDCFCL